MATVLVVDDDPINCHLVRATLTNHAVCEARGASEAYDAIRGQRPDLILLDLSLSGASGFDVLKHLRGVLRSNIPVLLYTATPPDESIRELMGLFGVDGFLIKPVEPEAMISLVEATLARR